ncbi:Acetate--CoA ligase [ADP-forming] II [Candidatus Tiddalikarchaeum anstoanum]|nr:Acetate--CoA ligase [ADP-forming] II [Candidatus Tiddalikarchaeum anstoanum]
MFSVTDSLRFMKTRGFNIARFYECKNLKELNLAFDRLNKPVVLKINSEKFSHKSDVKGVVLNINSKNELVEEFKRLIKLGEGVVIQEQVKGVELIIGLQYDDSFGPIIMLGAGGVFVELLKDVSFRACPINLDDAEEMIEELKTKKLLEGFRGADKVNKAVVKKLLVKLSQIADKERIKTLDLNPIIFDKSNYYVVDARMETLE